MIKRSQKGQVKLLDCNKNNLMFLVFPMYPFLFHIKGKYPVSEIVFEIRYFTIYTLQ